ncbi:SNF2-related protein [Lactiplantibacillus plantarum]|uniref:SNF2-related protein n=1 Tax=Lactiplantibacillus plantarum TaxID=1590 RepID=UPI0024BAB454|nr:SNF2-related protein [Lactiplantibacillus plantarum]MCG0714449.1 DNA repair helicase [Lactiplantibacillus plantarum]MCG0896365.1 DNA repair helicase [Lactiplantibacillus plantarum]WHQ52920.1 SNF2-related protein [Lactiplantibacillus plantarum]
MLSDLSIKPGYATPDDDVGKDFYDPVLAESVSYDRLSGYFSARALLYFSKGITNLRQKHGHYRLIISSQISQQDYDAILAGYEARDVTQQFQNCIVPEIHNQADDANISNLAYLIAIGLVDIKIGFTTDGLFHAKYGLMRDAEGNTVYFTGSFNETENAFAHNYETIDVRKSWTSEEEKNYINGKQAAFDKLWAGKNTDGMLFVKSINEIVYKQVAHYNKGELIMEQALLTPNSLVLYLTDNQLEIQNNLNEEIPESRPLRRIKQDFLKDEILWHFKTGLSYSIIENQVIPRFEKLAERAHFNFVVADSVINYIENSRYEIDKISKQGIELKAQEPALKPRLDEFVKIVDQEVVRTLRPIQAWVSFYMMLMQRVGNFSVPGSGKTAMVYGTFAYLSAPSIHRVNKMVVCGPKSSFLAWKTEFNEVFGDKRDLNVLDVQSETFRTEDFYKNVGQYNLILVNYESLPKYETALEQCIDTRTLLVFDEVHKLKGTEASRPKFAQPLADLANYKLALTGTPIPNGYVDIYNMLHLLYKDEYADYFGFSVNELLRSDGVIAQEVNEKLYPFFWRVTKDDLGVPAPEPDHLMKYTATNEEQAVIDMLWQKYGHQPFKLYIRLIQMASNPALLRQAVSEELFVDKNGDNDESETNLDFEFNQFMDDTPQYTDADLQLLDNIQTSTKFEKSIETALDLIEQGKHPVVWAIFVNTIDKFTARIEQAGYKVAKIYGAVSAADREVMIQAFQAGEYDLLISNPHTLAESVSLHHISHDALYLEYSFNLTHMLQSRDRIHRLGLPDNVKTNYYYFQLCGQFDDRQPIDELIYDRLKEKRDLMNAAIEGKTLQPEFSVDERQEIESMMKKFMQGE